MFSTAQTLGVALNPFVDGFDWWGTITMYLAFVLVAFVLSGIAWLAVGWFASDRLLVDGSTPNRGFCHGRPLNRVPRGLVAGLFVFTLVAAGLGSLIVHTERVEFANASSAATSQSAHQVDHLQQQLDDAVTARDTAIDEAIGEQYTKWLGLLGYTNVVDIDTQAQTATVVFPDCRRVVDLSGDVPKFVVSDDGNGNVTMEEVQHILIRERIAALNPGDPFAPCFPTEELAAIAAAAA